MKTDKKELFLTFDDGPVSGPTEFVVDLLLKFSIKATFFCIGDNIKKNPVVFKSIVTGGHTIGNHTYNHLNGWKTGNEKYLSNALKFDDILVKEQSLKKSHLFRPPYGCITRQQIKSLSQYKIIMWDVLSQDYNQSLSPERCLQRTIQACRPGSIIVFHDSYKAEKNMEYTLPRLIDFVSDKGFTFKAL